MRPVIISVASVLAVLTTFASAQAQAVITPKDKPSFSDRLTAMTPEQRDVEFVGIFKGFDKNNDGFIALPEAPRASPIMTEKTDPATEDLNAKFFISLYDTDEDGKISLSEYREKAASLFARPAPLPNAPQKVLHGPKEP